MFNWCSIFLWITYLKIQICIGCGRTSRLHNLTIKTPWWQRTMGFLPPVDYNKVGRSNFCNSLPVLTAATHCLKPCDKYHTKEIHGNEWQGHVKSISCEESPRDGWVGTGIEREGKCERLPVSPRQCTGNLFHNHSPLWLHCCWRRMLRELISTALHTVSVPPHTPCSQASPHPFHMCEEAARSHFH